MQLPLSDPTWIVESVKVIVLMTLGIIIFSRWYRSDSRFYTDFPFLMSISVIFIAMGEIMDVYVNSGFGLYTLLLYQFRVALVMIAMLPMLYMIVIIWFSEHMRAGKIFILGFMIFALSIIAIVPPVIGVLVSLDPNDLTRLIGVLLLFVIFIPFIVTFSWAWYARRLPDVNSGLIVLGMFVLISGQLFKAIGGVVGLYAWLWFAEVLDLIGFVVIVIGFVRRPGWASGQKVSLPASESSFE